MTKYVSESKKEKWNKAKWWGQPFRGEKLQWGYNCK